MNLGPDAHGAHLTYCTNIHKGETWAETFAALQRHVPSVKAAVSPKKAMGVGLRLSALASEQLSAPGELQKFKDFLDSESLYVFTINGFPYGPFHGTRVKEDVYQPDWRFEERLTYTNRLADQLSYLLPTDPAIEGSISTVPATFRPLGSETGALDLIAAKLLHHASHLARIRETTGRTITLALEPEPMCYLETSEELISFMQARIFSGSSVRQFAGMAGVTEASAEATLRRHLGICYDVCHAAIEFEDAAASIARLRSAGIGIHKLQLSAALKIASVDAETARHLRRFDDGVYLHQVVERRTDGTLVRYLDLQPAISEIGKSIGSEWRVHCHVPVFMQKLPELGTTQDFLREILALHKVESISKHLEVETYTFDVLPAELRQVDVATAVARELEWVKKELAS